MNLRDIYLFVFSLGVVLALFSYFNILPLDPITQPLLVVLGIALFVVGAALVGREEHKRSR
jgi:hypothetical protein